MKYPSQALGILADDLTGACDTALQFFNAGSEATVLLDYKAVDPNRTEGTWVVNTDSRHLEQYDAIAAVKKSAHFLIENFGIDCFYKKLDSTFRGHVAQECLALLDELRWKACVIAPAYPEQDRKTIGGYQLVGGIPLELTDAARDPLFPVRQSSLLGILGAQSSPNIVYHIPFSTVVHGAGPIKKALVEAIQMGKKLIVVDACADVDLEQLALAITLMPAETPVLPCGSAGLAKAITKRWVHRDVDFDDDERPDTLSLPPRPILLVMGSMHSTSRLQIETLLQHARDYNLRGDIELIKLTAGHLLGQSPLTSVTEQARQALMSGKNIVLCSSFPYTLVEETAQLAEALSIDSTQLPAVITEVLSKIAEEVLKDCPAHLVLSGGETANGVCRAMGSRRLALLGQLETSITLAEDQEKRYVVTKSGGFGDRMTLLNVIKQLEELSEA